MLVQPRNIDQFVRRPDPAVRAILVFGPDRGAVRERAEALCLTVVPDLGDTFCLVEIPARAINADPARLGDEAAAIPFGGGRRVIRIRDATNEISDRLGAFLDDPAGDALVVIEAGELAKRAKLRSVFEKAANGAAIGCYVDDGADLEALIRSVLQDAGLRVAPPALAYLAANLGGDRQLTRRELEKLALYVEPGAEITLEDAEACVGDGAASSLDDVSMAAGAGDYQALDIALRRCAADGHAPVGVVRAVQRHFHRLHLAVGLRSGGASADQAMASLRPVVFFKQKDSFRRQVNNWSITAVSEAMAILTEAEIDCKSTGLPDQAISGRALMRIAGATRRRK
jgi:DNA polymerase-3 subunit delta